MRHRRRSRKHRVASIRAQIAMDPIGMNPGDADLAMLSAGGILALIIWMIRNRWCLYNLDLHGALVAFHRLSLKESCPRKTQ